MSRELMLIPKLRYEQLIKHEKDETSEELGKPIIPSDKNSEEVQTPDQSKKSETSPIKLNQTSLNQSSTKHKRKKQNGGGKSYLLMPPEKMLKLYKKKGRLTTKRKWLSFHI